MKDKHSDHTVKITSSNLGGEKECREGRFTSKQGSGRKNGTAYYMKGAWSLRSGAWSLSPMGHAHASIRSQSRSRTLQPYAAKSSVHRLRLAATQRAHYEE